MVRESERETGKERKSSRGRERVGKRHSERETLRGIREFVIGREKVIDSS